MAERLAITIELVRHGESLANVDGPERANPQEYGDYRLPLTERGWEQARGAGRRLGAEFVRSALVFNSPYERTRQ